MSTIGDQLKRARIEKGYTLDDMQQITKIQKRYLTAIEEQDFASMPGDFYTRAFIRQYAEVVSIDGDALLAQLNETPYTVDSKTGDHVPLGSRRAHKTSQQPQAGNFLGKEKYRQLYRQLQPILPTVLLVGTVVVVSLAIIIFLNRPTAVKKEMPDPRETVTLDLDKPKEDDTDQQTNEPINFLFENQEGRQIHQVIENLKLPGEIVIKATNQGQTWVGVEINGEPVGDELLTDGNMMKVDLPKETQTIEISVGYFPFTSITINGERYTFPQEADPQDSPIFTWKVDK